MTVCMNKVQYSTKCSVIFNKNNFFINLYYNRDPLFYWGILKYLIIIINMYIYIYYSMIEKYQGTC